MTIKIITRHSPLNYGSLLQSIATQSVLSSFGYENEIIDYQRKDERGLFYSFTPFWRKSKWKKNPLFFLMLLIFRVPEELYSQFCFSKMRKKYLRMTKRCTTTEDLSKIDGDIFITGSDQVWGPLLSGKIDWNYFLKFKKDVKKIAFASSFGRTSFDREEQSLIKKYLLEYNKISVREKSAVDIISNMGVNCLGSILDPTLLLTATQWSNYSDNVRSEKYILIYQLHENEWFDSYAKKISQKTGMPVYRISVYARDRKRFGKLILLPSLKRFLSEIKGAAYLLTDSFHGTAFAINFNVQFIEILPKNNTETRNMNILHLTGLEDRILKSTSDFALLDSPIDYAAVNTVINKERNSSLQVLKELLS